MTSKRRKQPRILKGPHQLISRTINKQTRASQNPRATPVTPLPGPVPESIMTTRSISFSRRARHGRDSVSNPADPKTSSNATKGKNECDISLVTVKSGPRIFSTRARTRRARPRTIEPGNIKPRTRSHFHPICGPIFSLTWRKDYHMGSKAQLGRLGEKVVIVR